MIEDVPTIISHLVLVARGKVRCRDWSLREHLGLRREWVTPAGRMFSPVSREYLNALVLKEVIVCDDRGVRITRIGRALLLEHLDPRLWSHVGLTR